LLPREPLLNTAPSLSDSLEASGELLNLDGFEILEERDESSADEEVELLNEKRSLGTEDIKSEYGFRKRERREEEGRRRKSELTSARTSLSV